MVLGIDEIKNRAKRFADDYKNAGNERAEAQSFLKDFFDVFGISNRRANTFRYEVSDGRGGFIDCLWKNTILIEMKSKGKSLDKAFNQASDYFNNISEDEEPRYILVCDFQRFRLYDLDKTDDYFEFELKDLYKHIRKFSFLSGHQQTDFREQDPINIRACQKMGDLHDLFAANHYSGHKLEVFLVRLLFCLFADDTGIFEKGQFYDFVSNSRTDASDLGMRLSKLFQILDTSTENRPESLDGEFSSFPYIDGALFREQISMPDFTIQMRKTLLKLCGLDWGKISPAIFGSMFQSIMNLEERRSLGAHYTSEKNILKVIKPLFLDELNKEYENCRNNKRRLEAFHLKLSKLTFLDPACGCGNFLVVTYKELRELELKVMIDLYGDQLSCDLDNRLLLNVNQFYGIEIDDFASQIARTALWLVDHQMNMKANEYFGGFYQRFPISSTPTIVCGNALDLDWGSLIQKDKLSFILGNPPFVGARLKNDSQKEDMNRVFVGESIKHGNLDYVTAWYIKAARYIENTSIKCAFVSTNSICQGEQAITLWQTLFNKYNIVINFAHQTFKWGNEGSHNAAVFCVIIGFSLLDSPHKFLFLYETAESEPDVSEVNHINNYLINASNVFLEIRKRPLCNVSPMVFGSMPNDGGYLILSKEEKEQFVGENPDLADLVHVFLGAEEFINGGERYCLWLKDVSPVRYINNSFIMNRINMVAETRRNSTRQSTVDLAATPSLFGEIRQPDSSYLLFPGVSSEKREYIPIGFLNKDVIASNAALIVPNATLYEFGVLTSSMHMTWMRYVCGRLKSDYRYSAQIVYNNFPWPDKNDLRIKEIEEAALAVLDCRDKHSDCSLAVLYNPLTMPPDLLYAHQKLDKAVEKAYGRSFRNDSERIIALFNKYSSIDSPLFIERYRR